MQLAFSLSMRVIAFIFLQIYCYTIKPLAFPEKVIYFEIYLGAVIGRNLEIT